MTSYMNINTLYLQICENTKRAFCHNAPICTVFHDFSSVFSSFHNITN